MCMLHDHGEDHAHRHDGHDATPWYRTRGAVVLLGFLAIAGYFLWTEHRAHFIAFLPYALLLLCPLMHVFMHHGHEGHGHQEEKEDRHEP